MIGACLGASEGPGLSLGLVPVLRVPFGEVQEEGSLFVPSFIHSFILFFPKPIIEAAEYADSGACLDFPLWPFVTKE